MNYIMKPSLEYMSFIKAAATLWDPHDIRDLLKNFCISLDSAELREKWSKIEFMISARVPQLPLPESLKVKMLFFVRAVGREILNFILYNHQKYHLDIGLPNEFYWTPQGTIDKVKMAKMMVKDKEINIRVRYNVACIYCLEDNISELWTQIPVDCKKTFYSEFDPTLVIQRDLVVLWTYYIQGEVAKMGSLIRRAGCPRVCPYLYACCCALVNGNITAIQHFLQKVTSDERKEILIMIVENMVRHLDSKELFLQEYYIDILLFSLSQMENEQQEEVLKRHSSNILQCFLDWPRQIFFMEAASRMCNLISKEDCDVLLKKIGDKLENNCDGFNYQKLFREMWQQICQVHKKYVFDKTTLSTISYVLSVLFKIKDKNNIKLIFQDATCEVKNSFIASVLGENVCKNLIDCEEWDLLKFLIQECLSSKEEVVKFKEDFKSRFYYLSYTDDSERAKIKLDRFYLILDDFIGELRKRKCEDDYCEAKRLCDNF